MRFFTVLKEKLDTVVCEKLKIKIENKPSLTKWKKISNLYKSKIEIALIGKYVELKDSYISIAESLIHAVQRIKQSEFTLEHSSKFETQDCESILKMLME